MPEAIPTEAPTNDAPGAPLPYAIQARNMAKDQIKAGNQSVREKVIDRFVQEELASRANLLFTAITDREKKVIEVKKIKPNSKLVNPGNGQVTESYTTDEFEKLKKAQELVVKIDKAIMAAMRDDNPDWNELKKMYSATKEE